MKTDPAACFQITHKQKKYDLVTVFIPFPLLFGNFFSLNTAVGPQVSTFFLVHVYINHQYDT